MMFYFYFLLILAVVTYPRDITNCLDLYCISYCLLVLLNFSCHVTSLLSNTLYYIIQSKLCSLPALMHVSPLNNESHCLSPLCIQ